MHTLMYVSAHSYIFLMNLLCIKDDISSLERPSVLLHYY